MSNENTPLRRPERIILVEPEDPMLRGSLLTPDQQERLTKAVDEIVPPDWGKDFLTGIQLPDRPLTLLDPKRYVKENLQPVSIEAPVRALPIDAALVQPMGAKPPTGVMPRPIRNAHAPQRPWVKRQATYDRAEDMRRISPELADAVKNLMYYHLRHTYIHHHKGRKPKKGWPGR